jgi:hypothetical protein
MSPTKTRLIAVVAMSAALCAGAAKAGEVNWTIGVSAPLGNGASIGTVFSNGYPAPVYVAPAPVFHVPSPVVYARPAVVYAPAPVVYAPPVYMPRRVVVGGPVWVGGRWVSYDRHHHRHAGHADRGHWDRGDHRGPPAHAPQGGRGRHYPS